MIINLTVFIYEPLYWRVTADVVFGALFASNRQLFNEIVAYQELFCMVTLLKSSSNHNDGEGNVKIKKNMQQVWLINRKKNLNVQRTFWQISVPLSPEWRSQTLSKWQCDRTFRPRPDVSGHFWIGKFFFEDSKISTSTRVRIQIEFARPHVSGFTLSSSANL